MKDDDDLKDEPMPSICCLCGCMIDPEDIVEVQTGYLQGRLVVEDAHRECVESKEDKE